MVPCIKKNPVDTVVSLEKLVPVVYVGGLDGVISKPFGNDRTLIDTGVLAVVFVKVMLVVLIVD